MISGVLCDITAVLYCKPGHSHIVLPGSQLSCILLIIGYYFEFR